MSSPWRCQHAGRTNTCVTVAVPLPGSSKFSPAVYAPDVDSSRAANRRSIAPNSPQRTARRAAETQRELRYPGTPYAAPAGDVFLRAEIGNLGRRAVDRLASLSLRGTPLSAPLRLRARSVLRCIANSVRHEHCRPPAGIRNAGAGSYNGMAPATGLPSGSRLTRALSAPSYQLDRLSVMSRGRRFRESIAASAHQYAGSPPRVEPTALARRRWRAGLAG
jgi:hypothetical protein